MATAGNPHRTNRARSPRVQITYDIEVDGESRRKELPFVIGVLGDFAGKPDPPLPKLREREFIEVSRDNFNTVLRNMRPRLALSVPNELSADGSKLAVTLHFQGLEDFEPEQVARQIEPLRKLIAVREQLSALRATVRRNGQLGARLRDVMNAAEARREREPRGAGSGACGTVTQMTEMTEAPGSLSSPIPASKDGGSVEHLMGVIDGGEGDEADLRRQIATLLDEMGQGALRMSGDAEGMLSARIADIDTLLTAQVNAIIHAPQFQHLEASWRGLHYLVSQTDVSATLKVRVLHAPKEDLLKDLETASDFDQSALFKKVYEDEYGMFGGEPFGALIGDYEFGRHPQEAALLERISNIAAAAHAPFLSAASPALFGWDSFAELTAPRDLAKIFTSAEYIKWRAFRESEDARYVGLSLPRILMREPYNSEVVRAESFTFQEDVDGRDHQKYLWGNAAYAMGTRLADAFARYGWCATIRGIDGGGLVEGLVNTAFATDAGQVAAKGPTEIVVTDLREKELADLGFVPLVHCKGTDYAAFFSTQSCQKSKRYDTDEANANARLASQLQYILATSRFAHYLKVMMRDKTGTVTGTADTEDFLNRWLMNYCLGNPESADLKAKARKPLRDGRVTVREVKGKPGSYEAIAHLQPHFQLDELTVALRLVTELPAPARAR